MISFVTRPNQSSSAGTARQQQPQSLAAFDDAVSCSSCFGPPG